MSRADREGATVSPVFKAASRVSVLHDPGLGPQVLTSEVHPTKKVLGQSPVRVVCERSSEADSPEVFPAIQRYYCIV